MANKTMLSVWLPDDLPHQLKVHCVSSRQTVTSCVEQLVRQYVSGSLAPAALPPPTYSVPLPPEVYREVVFQAQERNQSIEALVYDIITKELFR